MIILDIESPTNNKSMNTNINAVSIMPEKSLPEKNNAISLKILIFSLSNTQILLVM